MSRGRLMGHSVSIVTREKISQALIGRICSDGCDCFKHSISSEHREKISQALMDHLGTRRSVETRLKLRENKLRFYADEKNRKVASERTKALYAAGVQMGRCTPWTEEEKERISQGVRRAWCEGRRRGMGYARPNKVELLLEELIVDFGFQFVGFNQLIVGGKNPDFWNGDKKLIELYGDYWHRGQDPQERIDLFKVHGYDCLVVWENEVRTTPEQVYARVKRWMN